MAIGSIGGVNNLYSSLMSATSAYGIGQNAKYYLKIADRLNTMEEEETGDSDTASRTDSASSSEKTSSTKDAASKDSSSKSTKTETSDKTEKTYTEEENMRLLSYYAGGHSIKQRGAAERAALIRKLTGNTGENLDTYA